MKTSPKVSAPTAVAIPVPQLSSKKYGQARKDYRERPNRAGKQDGSLRLTVCGHADHIPLTRAHGSGHGLPLGSWRRWSNRTIHEQTRSLQRLAGSVHEQGRWLPSQGGISCTNHGG